MKIPEMKTTNYLIYGFIIAVTIFTSILAYHDDIWLDEAYTMITTSESISYAIDKSINFELQPPVYFVVLTIWRKINDSLFFGRMLSVIFISLSLVIVKKISESYLPEIKPIWAVLLFGINSHVVWAAHELRVYALVVMLSGLLLLFFHKVHIQKTTRSIDRLIFILLSLVAIYTQYYMGFYLLSLGLTLLIIFGFDSFKYYLYDMVLPVLSLIPIYRYLPDQISNHMGTISESMIFHNSISAILSRIKNYLYPLNTIIADFHIRLIFYFLLLCLLCFILWDIIKNKKYRLLKREKLAVVSFVSILIITTIMLTYFIGIAHVSTRHTVFLIIPLIFSLLVIITWINFANVRVIVLIIFLFFSVSTTAKNSAESFGNSFLKQAAIFIENNNPDCLPIYIYRNEFALTFSRVYRGCSSIVPMPRPIDPEESYNLDLWNFETSMEIEQFFVGTNFQAAWLIMQTDEIVYDVDYNVTALKNYVSKRYFIKDKKRFNDKYSSISLWMIIHK